jgi:8-oxo-dGTP pyrophosphatase MutT (NUDIX family)
VSSDASALRPASAVILARQGGSDLELYMVRRLARASAFPDVWVFPGGAVQPADAEPLPGEPLGAAEALARLSERGGVPPEPGDALGLHRAALRELLEETGVLLAKRPDGRAASSAEAAGLREELRRGAPLGVRLAAAGLRADLTALTYFSHWITPEGQPRRFDTRFFVAALPAGQSASHCGDETCDGAWVAPRAALGRYADGEFPLVLPTRLHLQRLTPLRTLDDLLTTAASKPIRTVLTGRPHGPDDGRWWSQGGEVRGW